MPQPKSQPIRAPAGRGAVAPTLAGRSLAAAAVLAAGFAALAASSAQAQAVQPGEWTMTTTVTSMGDRRLPPAMAAAMMEPKTNQSCVTPEKAALGFRGLQQGSPDCTSKSMTLSGGMLDAVAVCKGPDGTRTMHLHGPYSATAYNLTAEVSKTSPRPTTMTVTMAAKRVGACH